MRIITCNVNGIRSACTKGFWSWMQQQNADVICLQEIKALEKDIPEIYLKPEGYHAFYHPAVRPGYSGVALICKRAPDEVRVGIGSQDMDAEGRYITADFGKLSVTSVYFPSGSSGELRQNVKYRFLDHFLIEAAKLRENDREHIFCGDFNIAHKEIDIKNWRANQKNSGFLPEERAWMDRLFNEVGYLDAFRLVNDKPLEFTWWSNRGRAYENNVGWRIDYHVISPGLATAVRHASVYKDEKFSDHAPLMIDYEYEI